MTSKPFVDELNALLDEAITAGELLMNLLDEERLALSASESDTLERVTLEKDGCLAQLEKLERRRRAICDGHNRSAEPADMLEVARAEDAGGTLVDQWQALRALMRQCQAANTVNGHVLRLRRQHVSRALAVLRGDQPEQPLYGPGGEENDNGDPPLLGEA